MWTTGLYCLMVLVQIAPAEIAPASQPAAGWFAAESSAAQGSPLSIAPFATAPTDAGVVGVFPGVTDLPPNSLAVERRSILLEDDIGGEPLPGSYPLLPATQFTATQLPRLGSSGFGVTSLEVHHTLLLGYAEHQPLNITPGIGVHFWSGPKQVDLPSRVLDVYADFLWQPLELEHGGLSLGLTPGLYGDFERLDAKTFQWTGWAMADYRVGPRLTLLGGIAYLRQLRSNWLPIGGLVWIPDERTRLELLLPKPKISRRWRETESSVHWVYIAGQLGGGAWAVADTPSANVLVGYNDLRLLAGCEGFHVTGREWRAEFGYVFARELTADNYQLTTPTDTFVAQGTFAF